MLSRRVPRSAEPNAWSRLLDERRASGARLLDLTEANPTRTGLGGAGTRELEALADPRGQVYPPEARGALTAREAVGRYYAERGIELSPEHVVLTAGTSEGYAHLFRMLCDPGQRILVPRPSYPLFEPLAALEGVKIDSYRLAYDGCWHLDAGSLERAIRPETRALVVVQPNHPTGSCLTTGERHEVERLCQAHDLALISDEVFGDFPWPGHEPRAGVDPAPAPARPPAPESLPSLLETRGAPTFVLSGLSKVCGMPQMKLSWIAVGGPERARARAIRGLEWIADLFLSVSTPVQLALPRLFEARHSYQSRVRERLRVNLAMLRASVSRAPELSLLAAEGGWVATLRMPGRRSEEDWALELLRRGVVVHPGHFYDFEEEAYLVVSLIVEPEILAGGLERIAGLVGEG